jgi:hypothetical protein
MNYERQAEILQGLAPYVRPLMLENDDETYPYTLGATCFFVTVRDALFMVTTFHGVSKWDPEKISVMSAGSSISVPFSSVHKAYAPDVDVDDSDYADFLFAKVSLENMEPRERELLEAYPDAKSLPTDVLHRTGNNYVFCGFPFEKSEIEYEEQHIKRGMRGGSAEYIAPFTSAFCHTLRFGGVDDIEDMNGFSGSPVFAVLMDNGHSARVALAGMVLRSTKQSGVMHILDWHFLYSQLLSAVEYVPE